jgi:hypothetical protein
MLAKKHLIKKHTVKLRLEKDGNVICTPHKLIAVKGQSIEWECEPRQPFTVDFSWESPFKDMAFQARAGEKIKISIPDVAPEGYFEYFVAIYDKSTGKIFTFDPELIIRR